MWKKQKPATSIAAATKAPHEATKTNAANAQNVQAVIFDFDGVIVNSAADIASAVNETLRHFHYKPLSPRLITGFIGNGVRNLLLKSLQASLDSFKSDVPIDKLDTILSYFQNYYREHAVEQTVLYDYIPESLETLYALGMRLAVVSNKPLAITEAILEHFDLSDFFDAVIGPELLTKIKPDPEGIALAVKTVNSHNAQSPHFMPITDAAHVVMVGDSAVDVQAARHFGATSCAFLAGLGDSDNLLAEKPDFVIRNMHELIDILN